MDVDHIRQLEELYQQINFLGSCVTWVALYGFDITKPAGTAQEAVQWLAFPDTWDRSRNKNGAAMSPGRVSTFLDIYFERDMLPEP